VTAKPRWRETDVAAADHDHARVARQARVERVDVRDRAHVVHSGQPRSRNRERARPASGRYQQLVVAQRAAVVQPQRMRGRVDLLDSRAELERDAFLRVKRLWPQQQPFTRRLAREVLLRQRRALIRRVRFLAEQRDRARIVLLA
jgi:hypothetical protein